MTNFRKVILLIVLAVGCTVALAADWPNALNAPNIWTAVQTFSAGIVNSCQGNVTLSGGNGTATNSCILPAGIPLCTDITASNPVTCTPSNGTMGITGTGSDVIKWVIVG